MNEVIRISYSTNVYILDVGPSQGWIHRDFVGGGGGGCSAISNELTSSTRLVLVLMICVKKLTPTPILINP